MKIAIVSYNHFQSTLCLTKYLAEAGCTIDYYAVTLTHKKQFLTTLHHDYQRVPGIKILNHDNAPEIDTFFKGLKIKPYLIKLFYSESPFLNFINKPIISFISKKIKRQNYDVINLVGQRDLLSVFYKYLKGQNITHTLHEVTPHFEGQEISQRLLNILLENNIKVITHSSISGKRYLDLPSKNPHRIKVIPVGKYEVYRIYEKPVNIEFTKKTENIFLYYGALKSYKGLDVLAKAIDLLKKRTHDFQVIIAGSGTYPGIDFFKGDNYCTVFNKYLNDEELIALNKLAKAIVCPYKSASQSGIILTTFAFGKPVIATKVGGFPEIISDGINGILIEPNSASALAEAMERLVLDSKLYQNLCDGVSSFGKNDSFDWKNIALKSIDFYKKK